MSETEPPRKQAGGRWRKGSGSPNPGGKKRQPEPAVPDEQPHAAEPAGKKLRGRPFQPGQSGNPKGRTPGSRNAATMAALAIMEADAASISQKAVELALGGDLTAIRLVLERLVSPARDRPIQVDISTIS